MKRGGENSPHKGILGRRNRCTLSHNIHKSGISVPNEEYREMVRRATGKDIFLFSDVNKVGSANLIKLIKNPVTENIPGSPALVCDIISYMEWPLHMFREFTREQLHPLPAPWQVTMIIYKV
ncbi:MAG TPA: hypothetical protein VMW76_05415 [Bacteroidales bacterium]|nr:hypothetical protein [Bacteroidales bacterium]